VVLETIYVIPRKSLKNNGLFNFTTKKGHFHCIQYAAFLMSMLEFAEIIKNRQNSLIK